jgi:tetratricopeptide (TPR) repeat protein
LSTVYTVRKCDPVQLSVSMEDHNILLEPGGFSFPRRHALRFEWLALLAYTRKTEPPEGGWVSIEEFQRLPLWRGKTIEHIGTNVGRYIQDLEQSGVRLLEAQTTWRGPYRLQVSPEAIDFDLPLEAVGNRLGRKPQAIPSRKTLLRFTEKYARAMSLFLEGRLSSDSRTKKRRQENAWSAFSALAAENNLDARLHLIANLAAVRVLDTLGRFTAAAKTLDDCERLVSRVHDPAVSARFFFANTKRYDRLGDKTALEKNLAEARAFATKSADLVLLAMSAEREGLRLSQQREYQKALAFLLQGLNARLLIDNFDAVQSSCFNIGNALQQMSEKHYEEAGQWLKLCVNICKWLHLGRYEALSEIILAKISLESGKTRSYVKWMREAEKLTALSRNALDLFWCHVIRAFYYQRHKKSEEVREELVKARHIYLSKRDFDQTGLEKYLARKFPDVWDEVVEEGRQVTIGSQRK